ncbi:MAG: PHP domain-containing protein [Clostridia bacterium]|nr:PHP domain-containing protein [Clostridia bacterium]
MYKYETHLHTSPVSLCAKSSARDILEMYKSMEYDGVFVTNHFLDGNIGGDRTRPYNEQLEFYFSDYDEAVEVGKEIGLKVFFGVEISYGGTDFLIYGLDKDWYSNNPQIMDMKKSEELQFMIEEGAFVIQAHPYRQASYIDHIRLYPHCVHGVEIINTARTDFDNEMAAHYAKQYGLLEFAGSDTHSDDRNRKFAGMCGERPISSEEDFIKAVKNKELKIFCE